MLKKDMKYRLEMSLTTNNSTGMWSSIDSITNFKGHKTTVSSDDTTLPNKVDGYYATTA